MDLFHCRTDCGGPYCEHHNHIVANTKAEAWALHRLAKNTQQFGPSWLPLYEELEMDNENEPEFPINQIKWMIIKLEAKDLLKRGYVDKGCLVQKQWRVSDILKHIKAPQVITGESLRGIDGIGDEGRWLMYGPQMIYRSPDI